jgi:hypothetical protein
MYKRWWHASKRYILNFKEVMKETLQKHKTLWSQKSFLYNSIAGILLVFASLAVNYITTTYSAAHVSNAVTDLFLSHLPVVNVGIIVIDGAYLFVFILIVIMFRRPHSIPFVLKSIALFVLIRALFSTLTHIAPPYPQALLDSSFPKYISSGYDLFFSGHTGLPFLMALIFWHILSLRYFFLLSSFIGGGASLLGHLHYSIDVLSAFFISYGIFKMCERIFKNDYKLLLSESPSLNDQ